MIKLFFIPLFFLIANNNASFSSSGSTTKVYFAQIENADSLLIENEFETNSSAVIDSSFVQDSLGSIKENESWSRIEKIFGFIIGSGLLIFLLQLLIPIRTLQTRFRRVLTSSQSRYFKVLANRIKSDEPFENFPELHLKSKSDKGKERLKLSEVLNLNNAIHIQGKPGSGKTSLVKKLIIDLCSHYSVFKRDWIPIYIKYSSGDIFSEIVNSLDQNEFFKDPTIFTREWLKKQLKKNKFLIIIDDIHNILANESKKASSEIESLLRYKKNKFVLISRDYYSACPFHFPLYEIEDISNNRELAEQILQIHTDEEKFRRIWMELGYGYKTDLLKLYNTPQLLKLLARVFDQKERFDDNKSLLFKRFLVSRHEDEEKKSNNVLPLELKERVLASVAYRLFVKYQESAYSVSKYNFREFLNQAVIQIHKKYGFLDDADEILKGLLAEGYLIKIDDKIQFEHDQWQEFFAALEIHQQEYSVRPFLTKSYGNEIALFVSGLYLLEEEIKKRNFWREFWAEVAISDFFLTMKCQNNLITFFADEVQKIYKDLTFDETDLINSYKKLAVYYEDLLEHHFPELKEKFAPYVKSDIGILLEKNENQIGFWYGYRPITDNHREKVILIAKNKDDGVNLFYEQKYQTKFMHSYSFSSAVHDPPAKLAFKDVSSQLENIIREGGLVETEIMKKEALFFETVSVSKILKGKSNITDISDQDILPNKELYFGIEILKKEGFRKNLEVPASTLSHGGLPKRSKSIEDFEIELKHRIKKEGLNLEERLSPPNSDLIDVIKKYRFQSDELTSEHREFLIERSKSFYQEVYRNYKYVIETNFPTAKSYFKTYSSFPIQVFLIKKEGKRYDKFGEHLVYFNVDKLKRPFNVEIIDERKLVEIKRDFEGYRGIRRYWGLSLFSRVEPIRNAVYSLIQDEFKELTRPK